MAKSRAHLLAISKRSSLSESLTDTLIERGDEQVIRKVAENEGARLSEKAYACLIERSEPDGSLLEKLGLRLDIPLHLFRRLLERATAALRERLLSLATPEKRDDIKEILASISNEVIENEDVDHDFAAAQRLVHAMQERGELDQMALLEFAKSGQYAATIAALAALCSAPVDTIKEMLNEGRNEPLLVFCKAAGLSWLALRVLLQDDLLGRAATEDELNKLKSDYIRLSHSTAKKLLEFWCEHQTPQKP